MAQKSAISLDGLNVDRLRTLVACLGVVAHLRALGERAIALADDAGVMDEQVLLTVVGADEAKALVVAEPLHGAGRHTDSPRNVCCIPRGCCSGNDTGRWHFFAGSFWFRPFKSGM